MKVQKAIVKKKILKKIFIKFCRFCGFEIIDQSNFYIPTQEKTIDQNLNVPGKKSINLPLGEIKVSRNVNALTVIFRSCTNVNMLTQNKKRLFDKKKSEYTFRSLNSIINSIKQATLNLPKIKFNIIIVDHNSSKEDLNQMKSQLNKSNLKNTILSLDVDKFLPNIKKVNSKNEDVTQNQLSNMSNINKSLLIAKNECSDLVYFVEDDYLHKKEAIAEMIFSYERISSQLNRELILCPTDYPYLYTKMEFTNIFLGSNVHWRKVEETLCTFLTSKMILEKYWDKFISMCQYEHYPFEQPLHDIYKSEFCLSPIPSIAIHLTNINSIFGLSPNVNWKKIWEDNRDY